MATTTTINRPDRPDMPRRRGDADAPHMSPITPSEDVRTIMINRISWGAVFAGVVLALVTQLLINMIGVGIGMATLDPGTGDNPSAANFSISAAIWWIISGVIASFAGGYAAGRMAGKPRESTAGWHGLIAWAATTLVIVYLLTSAVGSVLGGALSAVTNTVGGVASAVTQTAGTNTNNAFSGIEQSLRNATGGAATETRDAAVAAIRALLTGDPAQAQQARENAAQAIAAAQNIPIDQARTQVQQYEQQYRQTVGDVTQAADTATTAVSWGALLGALALALGALAAWFGGRAGAVDPTITSASPSLLQQRTTARSVQVSE
jgi:hypothetical protein